MAADGLISVKSRYTPDETLTRLEAIIAERGLTLFARIDHGAGATQVGLSLRPTVLLILGHARAGTPLMQSAQTAGIDLPLRILVWQDASGATWLSYDDVAWIAARHGAGPDAQTAVAGMAAALQAITSALSEATPAK